MTLSLSVRVECVCLRSMLSLPRALLSGAPKSLTLCRLVSRARALRPHVIHRPLFSRLPIPTTSPMRLSSVTVPITPLTHISRYSSERPCFTKPYSTPLLAIPCCL
ncbi:hypothetical protein TRVL_06501 [Trypanosoma vivax]|nr:hypothetical protein TRVL_06501 [Trypanosoma vivax]